MCGSASQVLRRLVVRDGVSFRIVTCGACAFVFVAQTCNATFRAVQQEPAQIPSLARHRHIKRLCDNLVGSVARSDQPCRVIEIGAGWGGLARLLSSDPRYQYIGFEPSASRARFCRAHGLEVKQDLFRGPASAGAAHAIVIDNVLEHVEHPTALMRDAVATLLPEGVLIVIVPNLNDVRQLRPAWRERHLWQPHCHINYFCGDSLRSLFTRCGLSFGYFDLGTLAGIRDWQTLPRVIGDTLGLHLFGLNCYGIKPASDIPPTGER
jgi:hypothetical protein